MKITGCDLFSFSLPFDVPLKLKNITLRSRDGLLVRLQDEQGNSGWGEVSPLPGFSVETLDQSLAQLKELRSHIESLEYPGTVLDPEGDFQSFLDSHELVSSVRFGMEMAALGLLAVRDNCSLASVFGIPSPVQVKVNGLISELDDSSLEAAGRLIAEGYSCLKLKVGRAESEREISAIKELSQTLPSFVTLRLDANRAFDYDQAVFFCREIADCRVEYIEEPLKHPKRISQLIAETSISVALDETLLEEISKDIIDHPGVTTVILKPTLLGGLAKSIALAELARTRGKKVVVTSTYETALGIEYLAHLAAKVAPEDAHGLSTLTSFENQITSTPPSFRSGLLSLLQTLPSIPIECFLTEVADD